MILINKINFSRIRELANSILIFGIITFAFMVSFSPDVGRKIVNNLFYIWLLTLNFKNILDYLKNNRIFLLIIIFFLWITFTVIVTHTTDYYNYYKFIKYFLLPLIIILTTINKEHIKYIISAFLIGMFVNELISYGIYFELIQTKFLGYNLVGNKSNPVPFLTSHIEYTLFLSLAIVMSLFTFFNTKKIYLKVILGIFTTTMMTNLFLTIGRTGQFTLLMTLLFLTIIYFRHNIKYIIISFLSIVAVFILAFNFSSNVNSRLKEGYSDIEKIIKTKDYDTSFGIRLSSYVIIPKIIQNENYNIFYGMGYCEVDKIIQEIHIREFGKDTRFSQTFGHLHNTYITIFAGTGIIGIVLFLLFWYQLLKARIEDRYLSYIRYTFLIVVTFGGFSSDMFWQREVMLLSSIFISIIIVSSYIKGKKIE